MTIAADGMRRWLGLSAHRLFAALLAVSVALNLCFVAGALWSRFNAPPAPVSASERFRKLEASLGLDDQQRVAYHAYVAATLARSARQRREIDPLLDAAWAEIAKPEPDNASLRQRFDEAATRWRGFQHEAVDATLALLARLSPEQREKFVADELQRRAAARRRHLDEAR
jgi:hypothetical protein